ncbi:NUDIX hydrolase [Arsenicicoccus sp. oral taxon 190]|uniref:NUDIX hydrolase n=1 Tax=Arsenicicoccus sp. oral taxon 190 TaxID=1658671 RepID=UPI000679F5EB|nr:NUDIX hydrolase [Arsenicicoccus sp. oral taxon 190]AKT50304.1 phosphohistidine phosphatase [Arsenicicoccus sp. oral taxon 190]
MPAPAPGAPVIAAAGAVPWRRRRGVLEVAMVHRPAYDDWAWAKGKLDPGEDWPAAAVREVEEESGLRVRLGRPLPVSSYSFVDRRGQVAHKHVRYWAAEVIGGDGRLEHEIDEVAWLPVQDAMARLDYARDREQLRAVVRHAERGALTTWPLVVVRHAKALPRSRWTKDDRLRPLDDRGRERARAIVPILDAFGVTRLVTSISVRCADTLAPYAEVAGLELKTKHGLTEEAFVDDPDRAVRHLRKAVVRGVPGALCSHGPVLPLLLEELSVLASVEDAEGRAVVDTLLEAADSGMAKGELLVCHLTGRGDDARVVAVERHLP